MRQELEKINRDLTRNIQELTDSLRNIEVDKEQIGAINMDLENENQKLKEDLDE
jgi:hypothetical protein